MQSLLQASIIFAVAASKAIGRRTDTW